MITKEKAREIAENYLREKEREYIQLAKVEEIGVRENYEILYGEREGEKADQYFIEYTVLWGAEEKGMLIYIDAEIGEVLYSISPTSWIEELEDYRKE